MAGTDGLCSARNGGLPRRVGGAEGCRGCAQGAGLAKAVRMGGFRHPASYPSLSSSPFYSLLTLSTTQTRPAPNPSLASVLSPSPCPPTPPSIASFRNSSSSRTPYRVTTSLEVRRYSMVTLRSQSRCGRRLKQATGAAVRSLLPLFFSLLFDAETPPLTVEFAEELLEVDPENVDAWFERNPDFLDALTGTSPAPSSPSFELTLLSFVQTPQHKSSSGASVLDVAASRNLHKTGSNSKPRRNQNPTRSSLTSEAAQSGRSGYRRRSYPRRQSSSGRRNDVALLPRLRPHRILPPPLHLRSRSTALTSSALLERRSIRTKGFRSRQRKGRGRLSLTTRRGSRLRRRLW